MAYAQEIVQMKDWSVDIYDDINLFLLRAYNMSYNL
jgi:hypothetical protein